REKEWNGTARSSWFFPVHDCHLKTDDLMPHQRQPSGGQGSLPMPHQFLPLLSLDTKTTTMQPEALPIDSGIARDFGKEPLNRQPRQATMKVEQQVIRRGPFLGE